MTLFSQIIDGEIPGEFVFKDERWVAFMDIFPAAPGHTLLVPHAPVQYLSELPGGTQACMGQYISALSACVKQATAAPALSVLVRDGKQAGQEVPHVHIHFIPRHDGQESHRFGSGPQASSKAISDMAAQIRSCWTGI